MPNKNSESFEEWYKKNGGGSQQNTSSTHSAKSPSFEDWYTSYDPTMVVTRYTSDPLRNLAEDQARSVTYRYNRNNWSRETPDGGEKTKYRTYYPYNENNWSRQLPDGGDQTAAKRDRYNRFLKDLEERSTQMEEQTSQNYAQRSPEKNDTGTKTPFEIALGKVQKTSADETAYTQSVDPVTEILKQSGSKYFQEPEEPEEVSAKGTIKAAEEGEKTHKALPASVSRLVNGSPEEIKTAWDEYEASTEEEKSMLKYVIEHTDTDGSVIHQNSEEETAEAEATVEAYKKALKSQYGVSTDDWSAMNTLYGKLSAGYVYTDDDGKWVTYEELYNKAEKDAPYVMSEDEQQYVSSLKNLSTSELQALRDQKVREADALSDDLDKINTLLTTAYNSLPTVDIFGNELDSGIDSQLAALIDTYRRDISEKYGVDPEDSSALASLGQRLSTEHDSIDTDYLYTDSAGNNYSISNLYYEADNREKFDEAWQDEWTKELLISAAKLDHETREINDDIISSEGRNAAQYTDTLEDLRNKTNLIRERLSEKGYDLDRMLEYLNTEEAKQRFILQSEAIAEYTSKNGWTATLANLGALVLTPIQAVEAVTNTTGSGSVGDLESYVPKNYYGMDYTNFSSTVRGTTANMIEEKITDAIGNGEFGTFLAQLGSDTYSGLSSALQSRILALVASAVVGPELAEPLTLAIMGFSAMGEGIREGIDRGLNNNEIITTSIASGINEVLFEKLSLDKFLGTQGEFTGDLGKDILDMLKSSQMQRLVEGSEEIFTDIANTLADQILTGDRSEYNTKIKQYEAQGMSEADATEQANKELIEDIVRSGFGGYIGGGGELQYIRTGVMDQYYRSRMYQDRQSRAVGQSVERNQGVSSLTENARQTSQSSGNADLAQLADVVAQHEQNRVETKETRKQRKQRLTDVGKLASQTYAENYKSVLNSQNKATETVVKEELQKLSDSKPSSEVVSAVVKTMNNEDLTAAEKSAVRGVNVQKVVEQVHTRESDISKLTAQEAVSARKRMQDVRNSLADLSDKVSKTGSAYNTKTHKDVEISEISNISETENGTAMTLTLKDGTKVNADDIQYADPTQAMLYDGVRTAGLNASVANSVIKAYDGQGVSSAFNYVQGMLEGFQYGSTGQTADAAPSTGFFADLSEIQKNTAIRLGEIQGDIDVKAVQDKIAALTNVNNGKARVGSVEVRSDLDALTARQRNGVEGIQMLVDEGVLANNFHFYASESKTVNGKTVQVLSESDARAFGMSTDTAAPNGFYDAKTGDIYIDLNAGNSGEGAILFTAAHELTHFVKQWSPDKFRSLANFLVSEYNGAGMSVDSLVRAQMRKSGARNLSYDAAFEEMVADSMQTMFTDGSLAEKLIRLKAKDSSLFGKLREQVQKLQKAIHNIYDGLTPGGPEQEALSGIMGSIDKLANMFAEGITEATENYKMAADAKNLTAKQVAELDQQGFTVQNGLVVAKNMADAAAKTVKPGALDYYSYRTEPQWEESVIKEYGDTPETRRYIEAIKAFTMSMVADDAVRKIVPMGSYAYDKHGPLRDNVEYVVTFDMDTSCPRTFQFLKYRDAIQAYAKRPLTYNESVNLLELMRAFGQNIPCSYCYVENKRVLLSAAYNNFFAFRNNVLNEQDTEKAKTLMYGYKNGTLPKASQEAFDSWRRDMGYNPTVSQVWEATQTARNSVFNYLDELFRNGVVSTKQSQSKIEDAVCNKFGVKGRSARAEVSGYVSEWLYDTYAEQEHSYFLKNDPSVSNVDTRALTLNHEALAYAKSASSAKTVSSYVPYTDQLKNIPQSVKDYVMGMGGIRKHSSNDFRIDYVQDYLMFYADLAAGGWTGHTYTKSTDFVKIFGNTGDRINMSIAMTDGPNGAVRENNLEGMYWKDARELRNAYKNAGVMSMVTSDAQLSYALNADWIDMAIPFHASSLDKKVWYDLRHWFDYTSKQLERFYNSSEMELALIQKALDDAGVKYSSDKMNADLVAYAKKAGAGGMSDERAKIVSKEIKRLKSLMAQNGVKYTRAYNYELRVDLLERALDKAHVAYSVDGSMSEEENYKKLSDIAAKNQVKIVGREMLPAEIEALYNSTFGIKAVYGENGKRIKPHFLPGETVVDGVTIPGHNNDVNKYLELCREYGVHPRFDGVAVQDKNGKDINVIDHEGYIKLIKETARTDSAQEKIQFNFDRYDDYLKMTPMEYAMQQLQDYAKIGGYNNLSEDPMGIKQRFIDEYLGQDRAIGWFSEDTQEKIDVLNEYQGLENTGDTEALPTYIGDGLKLSGRGTAEDGRKMYESNFPIGTPRAAKSERILNLIQNVWSKKPITLVISNGDSSRTIQAQFDPTVDTKGKVPTDATKLAGGNRHGSRKEQRVTLDLADDYYEIASDAIYNYSKKETGKETSPHKGVKLWHYFINQIYFAEYGSDQFEPYTVTINVKEKTDGTFVYSFNAEKEFTFPRRTLHADEVVTKGDTGELFYENVNTGAAESQEKFSNLTPDSDGFLHSDRVTDPETLAFLNNQEGVTVYRAMQEIDGKLYPPMNAYGKDANGKRTLLPASEIGAWEQSVERPDLIDPKTGKFVLDKGDTDAGKGSAVPAAYNPYIHTSLSMLNDQFSSAWDRSNLVVVEGVVPESELTSGYKAQYAKDAVGKTSWHSGPVATELNRIGKPREVILSRWFKPVRIVENPEVAKNIAETLKGTNISIPENTVSPKLLAELRKQGVSISSPKGLSQSIVNKHYARVNGDVKLSARDSEGNTLTPEQAEYFKDSKVRDEDGNLRIVYHGTDADFTVFDRTKGRSTMDIQGMFFSPWDIDAEGYGPNVKAYYLNITNPAPEGLAYKALNLYKGQNNAGVKAREYLEKKGYDGVNNGDEEYIAFHPEQIKEVQNFKPTENPDVRYQGRYSYEELVSKPDMQMTLIDAKKVSNRADIVVNAKKNAAKVGTMHKDGSVSVFVEDVGNDVILSTSALRHGLDRRAEFLGPVTEQIGSILKNSIRVNELTPKKANASGSYVLIGAAVDQNGSTYVVRSVVNQFTNEVEDIDVLYAVNAKKGTGANHSPRFTSGGSLSLSGSSLRIADLLDLVNQNFADILPEDVLEHYEYESRPEGDLGVSALYSERDPDATDARTLLSNALLETAQNDIERKYITEYQEKISEMNEEQNRLNEVRSEIREMSFSRGPRDTAKLRALREEATKIANRLNIYDKQLLRLESMTPMKAVVNREKASAQERIANKLAAQLTDYRNKVTAREYVIRIQHEVKGLQDRLEHPKAKTVIPEAFARPVASFLSGIDFTTFYSDGTPRAGRANITRAQLQQNLRILSDSLDEETLRNEYWMLDISPDMKQWIDNLTANLNQYDNGEVFVVNKMSPGQLEDLYKTVVALRTAVNRAGKMYTNMSSDVSDLAHSTIDHLSPLAGKKHSALGEAVFKTLGWDYAQPVTAFERFGEGGKQIYNGLVKGQRQEAIDVNRIREFADQAYTREEVNGWQNELQEVEIGGEAYNIPVSYIMEFYAMMKDADARRHIVEGGGVRFDDLTIRERGRKTTQRFDNTMISEDEVRAMTDLLTDRQKEVADNLQEFMDRVGADWGNEISMTRFGYHAFGQIQNYYPIRTIKQGSEYEAQQKRANIYALLNKSFTKERVTNANNAVIIGDMFKTFTNHMSEMAVYHSWALPVIDTIKWFNYREGQDLDAGVGEVSTKNALRMAYGQHADEYVRRLLESINSQKSGGLSETLAFRNLRMVNRVAVAGNIRVAVQQPFSITRAFELLNPKYVRPLSLKTLKSDYAEMVENSSFGLWKGMGYYDVDISRPLETEVLKNSTFADRVTEKTMVLAELGDQFTWSTLWHGCKLEAMHNGLSGEEMIRAAADKFDQIITHTQVVDSVLTKSQWMRSDSFWHRMTSSFMSEPMTSYNTLLRKFDQYRQDAAENGKQHAVSRNWRGIAKTLAVFALTQAVNALVTAPIDASRDDDDYKTWLEKLQEKFKKNFIENMIPTSMMPYISDMAEYVIYGSEDRPDLAMWTRAVDAAKQIYSLFDEEKFTVKKAHRAFMSGLTLASSVSGLPLSNMARDAISIWNTVIGDVLKVDYGTWKFQTAKDTNTVGYQKFIEAMRKGDDDRVDYLYMQMVSNGVSDDTMYDGIWNEFKKIRHNLDSEESDKLMAGIMEYFGKAGGDEGDAEAEMRTNWMDYSDAFEDSPLANYSAYKSYWNSIRPAGIDIETYEDYYRKKEDVTGVDLNGDGKADNGTKKAGIMDLINSYDLTDAQKDTLLRKEYKDTDLSEAPWHYDPKGLKPTQLSRDDYKTYLSDIEKEGIEIDTFIEFRNVVNNAKGVDANGDGRADNGTKMAEVADYIDSLPLTNDQKDVLFLNEYKVSNLKKTPWHQ